MKKFRLAPQTFLLFVLFFALFLVCSPHQALCQGGISGAPAVYATRKAGPTALRMTRQAATRTRSLLGRSGAGSRTQIYRRKPGTIGTVMPRYARLPYRARAMQVLGTRTRRVAGGAGFLGYPLRRSGIYSRVRLGRELGRKRRMVSPLFSSFVAPRRRMALRGGMNWLGGIESRLLAERKKKYRPLSLSTSRLAIGYSYALQPRMRVRAMDFTGMFSQLRRRRVQFSGWNRFRFAPFPNL